MWRHGGSRRRHSVRRKRAAHDAVWPRRGCPATPTRRARERRKSRMERAAAQPAAMRRSRTPGSDPQRRSREGVVRDSPVRRPPPAAAAGSARDRATPGGVPVLPTLDLGCRDLVDLATEELVQPRLLTREEAVEPDLRLCRAVHNVAEADVHGRVARAYRFDRYPAPMCVPVTDDAPP
jgi:hypothetical protein